MGISNITPTDLQDEIIGPNNIDEHREQATKRTKDEKYLDMLGFFIHSVFQDFESYLRTEIDLVEDDIRLVLDENNSGFITYELEPGIYTFEDFCEALFKNLRPRY